MLAPHPLPPRWPMKPPLCSRFPFGDRAQSERSGGCPAPHRALPAVLFPIPVPCHSPATSCMLVVPRTEQTLRPPSQMRGADVAEGVLSQAPGQVRAGASQRGPRLPPWRGGEARAGDVVAAGPRPRARGHGEVAEGWAGGQAAAAFVCTPIINASPLRFANNSRLSLSGDKWAPLKFSFSQKQSKETLS